MQSPNTETLEIVLNGEPRRIPSPITVLELIEFLGIDPQRVAVELDRVIVRRAQWGSAQVGPVAQVEIVQFVGGG